MTETNSNVRTTLETSKESSVVQGVRDCYDSLLNDLDRDVHVFDQLTSDGWTRTTGFHVKRVLRRVLLGRVGMRGLLSRKGISITLRHCRRQGLLSGVYWGFADGYIRYRTHILQHAAWPGAVLLLAESETVARQSGVSVGLWLFPPEDYKFLEPLDYRERFNCSGKEFSTLMENNCDHEYHWEYSSGPSKNFSGSIKGLSAFGSCYYPRRDWSLLEFYCSDYFLPQLLPHLDRTKSYSLYNVVKHSRYF